MGTEIRAMRNNITGTRDGQRRNLFPPQVWPQPSSLNGPSDMLSPSRIMAEVLGSLNSTPSAPRRPSLRLQGVRHSGLGMPGAKTYIVS